jgi:hypothetical protein
MKRILTFLLFLAIAFSSYSQSYINVWGNYKSGASSASKVESLPETFLSADPTGKASIIYERIKTPDFVVTTSDGKKCRQSVIQYKAVSDFSVITKTKNGWFGYFNNGEGSWSLTETGVVKDGLENLKGVGEVDEIEVSNTSNKSVPQTDQAPPDFYDKSQTINKVCKVYIEVCNDLYVRWGSNTVNQVSTLFGTVKELYARDGIKVQLGEVFIWTTVDPYAALTSASSILPTFANNRVSNPWRFKHLLNNKNYGGIAYISSGTVSSFTFAYSGIGGYSVSSSSTVYSWPTYVFAHEMGHNLGSRHTHWGCWTDTRTNTLIGRLDSCYSCEPCGSTAPNCNTVTRYNTNGTIMSYCHINGSINLNKGFGLYPGATIRTAIWNSDIPFETGSCTTTYSAWSACSGGSQTRTFTQTGTNCVTPPADSLSRNCVISQPFQITNQVCYKGTDGKWRVKFNMSLAPTSYPTISLSLCRYGNSTGNCNGANLTPSACGARTFSALTAIEKATGIVDRVMNPAPAVLNSCYRMQIKYGTTLIWTPYFIAN